MTLTLSDFMTYGVALADLQEVPTKFCVRLSRP
jgi:hypothetical protein